MTTTDWLAAYDLGGVDCPDCGKPIYLFGESHIDEVAMELDVPVVGRIPLDPAVAAKVDAGAFDEVDNAYLDMVDAVIPVGES